MTTMQLWEKASHWSRTYFLLATQTYFPLMLWEPYWLILACLTMRLETFRMWWVNEYMTYPVCSLWECQTHICRFWLGLPLICILAFCVQCTQPSPPPDLNCFKIFLPTWTMRWILRVERSQVPEEKIPWRRPVCWNLGYGLHSKLSY